MANWASASLLGDPSSAEWQRKNLTTINVGGERWQVYKPAAKAFEGLLNELRQRGYKPKSSGGFNYRNIRGSNRLSQHAFGTAIDINAATNPLGQVKTDIPFAAALAAKYNLDWGGNWKSRPDPMHFEYRGGGGVSKAVTPPASPQQAVDRAPFQPMQQQQPQQPLSQQFLAGLDYSPKTLFRNQLFEGMANPEAPFSRLTFMSDMMAGVSPLRRPIVQGLSRLFGLG